MTVTAAVLVAAATVSLALSAVALSILGSPKAAKALIALTVIGLIGGGVAAAVLDESGSSKSKPSGSQFLTGPKGNLGFDNSLGFSR